MINQYSKIKIVFTLISFLSVSRSLAFGINKCQSFYKTANVKSTHVPSSEVKPEGMSLINQDTLNFLNKVKENSKIVSGQLKAVQEASKTIPVERLHRPKSGYSYHSLAKGASTLKELSFLSDHDLKLNALKKMHKAAVSDSNTGMSFSSEVFAMKTVIAKWNLPLLGNRSSDPRFQPIAEMRVAGYSNDGYEMLIKPNYHLLNKKLKLNLDEFFIGPIEITLHLDGTMSESRKSFSKENHPLNSFSPTNYRYYFEPLMDLKLNRFILTQRTLDIEPSQRGLADVFFKYQNGNELKSLSQVSGFKFNRILPITESLYLTEVFEEKTNSSKIQLLEYEPQINRFEVFADYSTNMSLSNILAGLFTPYNRQGLFDLNFNPLVIEKVKDAIRISAKDQFLSLYRGSDKYDKILLEGGTVSGPGFQKLIETRPLKSQKEDSLFYSHYNKRSVRTNNGFYSGVKDVSSNYIRKSSKNLEILQEWKIPGTSLSQYIYEVNKGYIVQREGLNDNNVLQHEIFFLSETGEVKLIGDSSPNLGTMTIFDGHLFFFGPSGENLNIWKLDELL